jgi:hypothetical protein
MSHPFLNLLAGAALAFGAGHALSQSKAPAGETPAAPSVKELGMENAHAMCIGCHGIPIQDGLSHTYHVPKMPASSPATS